MLNNEILVNQNIQKEREALKISGRELAKLSGLSQATISRIESGERKPKQTELRLIADACGISLHRLLGDSSVHEELRCAGRTDNEEVANQMFNTMAYYFDVMDRLDRLGI